jgi:hypothetical protein
MVILPASIVTFDSGNKCKQGMVRYKIEPLLYLIPHVRLVFEILTPEIVPNPHVYGEDDILHPLLRDILVFLSP